ncbi:putative quinol monooxygenase [Streptomyces sp. NPDC057074]|uniref:putative quinol monooxygenase n=1 Tax=Streptomyces sp. NPDC057074 TaxID=3346015 RepID=UPI003636287C
MSIEITVLFDVLPERLADTAEAFGDLCAATRREQGALRFDAWRSEEHGNVIVLVEEWADQTAIDLHMKEPYVADFLARTDGAFTRPAYVHRLRPLAA